MRWQLTATTILFLLESGASVAAVTQTKASPATVMNTCPRPHLQPNGDALDAAALRAIDEGRAPGISLVVVKDGRVRKLAAYGYADLASCVPATSQTRFGIGSISKQFTAVATLTLVRDGRLSLDDPIVKFLPEGRGKWDGITVRHLLTHTSGIPDYCGDDPKFPSISLDRTSNPPTPDLLRQIAKAKLNFPPGADWAYSNTGYVVLSAIIERVSKTPFPQFMRDRIFRPLGMTATRYYSPTALIPGRASGYLMDAGGHLIHGAFISDQFSRWGDTGMLSTASDMARWLAALGKSSLLPQALWREMTRPVRLNDGSTYHYGFGIDLDQVGEQPLWAHSGSFRVGYTSYLDFLPGRGLGVVTLANLNDDSSPVADLALRAIGTNAPPLAPSFLRDATPDPQPKLTAALVATLKGSDVAHGGIAMTGAFARHDYYHQLFAQLLASPGVHVNFGFVDCNGVQGRPPAALGETVSRACTYRLTGPAGVPPGVTFWLTPKNELAGLSFW